MSEELTIRKAKIKEAALRRENDIRTVMGTREGRSVLWQLWDDGHTHSSPYAVDPYATAFNCGAHNLAMKLMVEVQSVCPELWLLAMNEAHEKEKPNE